MPKRLRLEELSNVSVRIEAIFLFSVPLFCSLKFFLEFDTSKAEVLNGS